MFAPGDQFRGAETLDTFPHYLEDHHLLPPDPLHHDQYDQFKKHQFINFNNTDVLDLQYEEPNFATEDYYLADQKNQELPSISSITSSISSSISSSSSISTSIPAALKEIRHPVKLEARNPPHWSSSHDQYQDHHQEHQQDLHQNAENNFYLDQDQSKPLSTPLSIDTNYFYDQNQQYYHQSQYLQDSPVTPTTQQSFTNLLIPDKTVKTAKQGSDAGKKLSKWKEKVTKSTDVCVVCGDKSSG